jgi:DNA-binding MarR family transcriptional regulator
MPSPTRLRLDELRAFEARKRASLGQVLLRSARLFNERALARVRRERGVEVRPAHLALLPHIDLGGTRLTELAARAGVTKQAVGQLVETLEALGMVRREPDPDDARARRVVFTRQGFEAMQQGLGVLEALDAELAAALGKRRVAELTRELLALMKALESAPGPQAP